MIQGFRHGHRSELASWQPSDLKPYIATALALFGTDRVMWGSDWPVCVLAPEPTSRFSRLFNTAFRPIRGEKAMVLATTPAGFYGID